MQEIGPIWQSWWAYRKIFGLKLWLVDSERQIHDTAYMWNPKNGTNKLIYKAEIEPQI